MMNSGPILAFEQKFSFLEINEMSDMNEEEFSEMYLGLIEDDESERLDRFWKNYYHSNPGVINVNINNTSEELDRLEKIYASIDRTTLPDSYDSRALGINLFSLLENLSTLHVLKVFEIYSRLT